VVPKCNFGHKNALNTPISFFKDPQNALSYQNSFRTPTYISRWAEILLTHLIPPSKSKVNREQTST